MKVAILSESPADETSLRILVDAVLRKATKPLETAPLRVAGWSGLPGVIPKVLMHLHYHTDVQGLVVVADSDDSPPHDESHQKKTIEGLSILPSKMLDVTLNGGLPLGLIRALVGVRS